MIAMITIPRFQRAQLKSRIWISAPWEAPPPPPGAESLPDARRNCKTGREAVCVHSSLVSFPLLLHHGMRCAGLLPPPAASWDALRQRETLVSKYSDNNRFCILSSGGSRPVLMGGQVGGGGGGHRNVRRGGGGVCNCVCHFIIDADSSFGGGTGGAGLRVTGALAPAGPP